MYRILSFLIVFSALGACAQSAGGANQANLNVQEVNTLLDTDKEVVLIDVRTPEEYKQGHIEGSDLINFYGSDFQNEIAKLDKGKEYVIYCRSGGRSGKAVNMMQQMGFEKVHNMSGGILAWNRANLKTVK